MKFYLLFLSISMIFLISCEKDPFILDKKEDLEGLIAKEYIYFQEDFIAYIDYHYYEENNLLESKKTYTTTGELYYEIDYEYSPRNFLQTKKTINHSVNTLKEDFYQYNYFDSILSITTSFSDNSSVLSQFSYNESFQKSEKQEFSSGLLLRYTVYHYNTLDKIWLIKHYSPSDSLTAFEEYKYFSNNSYSKEMHTATAYFGYIHYKFNTAGNIIRKDEYNANNILEKQTLYSYNNRNQLICKEEFDKSGMSLYKRIYVYH